VPRSMAMSLETMPKRDENMMCLGTQGLKGDLP